MAWISLFALVVSTIVLIVSAIAGLAWILTNTLNKDIHDDQRN